MWQSLPVIPFGYSAIDYAHKRRALDTKATQETCKTPKIKINGAQHSHARYSFAPAADGSAQLLREDMPSFVSAREVLRAFHPGTSTRMEFGWRWWNAFSAAIVEPCKCVSHTHIDMDGERMLLLLTIVCRRSTTVHRKLSARLTTTTQWHEVETLPRRMHYLGFNAVVRPNNIYHSVRADTPDGKDGVKFRFMSRSKISPKSCNRPAALDSNLRR